VETQPEQPAEVPNTPTEVQDTPAAETEAPQEEQSVLTPEAGVETLPEDTMETEPETEETDTMPPTQATTGETETEATDEILQTPPPEVEKQDKWNVTVTIDHFAILVDHDGNFLELRNTEDYTSAQAEEIMCGILETGQQQGMYGWLQYYVTEKEYGTLIVVTDKTSDQGLLNNLFRITVIVGCLMLLLLFVLLCIFSRWITMPVQTAFDRQKQFVSDAGHELKTPLTILSANADILQDEIGENKWLGYMREQTGRMSQLVGDLLRLARMDNASQEYVFTSFNLSTAVAATALPFESQAFELHKNLELDVQPDVSYNGSEQHIRQLVAIFIDNALKYSDENGIIKVTLLQRGDNRILEFYNTGCEISADETEKIFERFYRGDKARGNSGKKGYGLGLAIARSIMDIHKIKIQVTCEQNEWIRFLLTM
jgi:signal transduction histidine kinase